ncbi:MAG: tetratricopeptide repeat protein [Alphaproteobacteria bacterium]
MTDPLEALQTALRIHQRGEHASAALLLRQLLARDARHPDALHLLGLCLHAQGDSVEALKQIRKAIAIKPSEPVFHTNAGAVAVALGEVKAGIECYRRAIELDPAYSDAYNNLGVALQDAGLLEEAATVLRRAIALRPDGASALVNLGNVLRALGETDKAVEQYRRAIKIAPDLPEAHNNLGNALRSLRLYAAAIESFDRALALRPSYSEAYCNRARVLAIRGDSELALESFERAIAIRPDPRYRLAHAGLLPVIPRSGPQMREWRERFVGAIAALLAENFRVPESPVDSPVMAFYLAYQGENDRDVMVLLSQFFRQAYPSLQWTAPHCAGRLSKARAPRIRVGLFSSYLWNHAVAWTIRGLLEQLPRDRFEIVLFSVRQPKGVIVPEIRAVADNVVELRRSLDEARAAIADACLDVLIFADIGMEALSYALAHARLAPVQCATWGHPVTTGISTVDYYISSDLAEPADADAQYSERLVRLAGVQTCYRRPAFPADRSLPPAPDLPVGATLYLCPQSLFKIHPDMDGPLSEILRRDPNGILLMFDGMDQVITDRLKMRWSAPFQDVMDRVRFIPRVSVERFLGIVASADVLLDSWPFGGGNTSYQGFAAGVPIVTLPGKYLRGRGTLTHYHHMGFTDCVADTPEGYVDIAVRLGTDADFRRRMTTLIRERCHVLFDDERVGADLSRFLLEVTA